MCYSFFSFTTGMGRYIFALCLSIILARIIGDESYVYVEAYDHRKTFVRRYKRKIYYQIKRDRVKKEWLELRKIRIEQNKVIKDLVGKVKKYENIMNHGKDEEMDGYNIPPEKPSMPIAKDIGLTTVTLEWEPPTGPIVELYQIQYQKQPKVYFKYIK